MTGVENLRQALDALAAVPVTASAEQTLGEELIELLSLAARLDGEISRRLAAFDGRGGALLDGAASTTAWLRGQCLLSPGEARQRVVVARALDRDLPATAAALAEGDVTLRHAVVIAAAVEDLPAEVVTDAETALVAAARLCDPSRLRLEVSRVRHALAPDCARIAAAEAFDRRRLHVSATFEGMVAVDGMLDPEGGAVLLTALAALAAPVPDDARTPAQRRADALVTLCRRQLDAGTLPNTGGERPHLTVVVDLPTLQGTPGAPPAELGSGGPLGTEALLRLACDASVVRIVTAGESEILDVGRRTRIVPVALRRALDLRDLGCVFQDCDRPPSWCDAHHLTPWARGGSTDLDNLALLCGFHHHTIHDRGWTLQRHAGRWRARRPDPPAAEDSRRVAA